MVTGMTARGQIPTACLYIAISLVLLCASSAAESQHEQLLNASFLDQLVNQLQTEVAELRQTVALLHGGAALVPEQTHLRPIGTMWRHKGFSTASLIPRCGLKCHAPFNPCSRIARCTQVVQDGLQC